MFARWPPGRRIAAAGTVAFCLAVLIVTVFGGFSTSFPMRMLQTLAVAVAAIVVLAIVIGAITGRLADYREPADEEEFEPLVRRSERLARENLAAEPDEARLHRRSTPTIPTTSRSSCARRSTTCPTC